MFDPSKVLSQILTNITSNTHPPKPQLPSLFDYFVKTCSADLIHPAVIEKWTENNNTTPMTGMNNESSFSNEDFYSIPASFVNQVALEIFDSLADADQLEIQQANEKAYHDAMLKYKDEMKIMYQGEGTDHGEYGALEMAAGVLEPIMAALEALTDLHMIGWAGGPASSSNGIGIINTALQASSLESQIGSQNIVIRQAPLSPVFAFPTPAGTPLRSTLVPQRLNERQIFDAYMGHRSESLPPIRTLNPDEGSTAYRSQVTGSASEGLQLLIQKRKQDNDSRVADREYRKYFSPLIATIPDSAKNLLDGLKTVIKVNLGPAFRDIVRSLIEIETLYGFRSPRRGVPSRLRPSEVSNWIASGRGRTAGGRVLVFDIEKFSKAWWKWWIDMQPDWRECDAHGKPKQMVPIGAEEEDWTCLRKPGANGLISVIAGLSGWGAAVKRRTVPLGLGEKKLDWFCAVEDCRWVMERLIKCLEKKKDEEWSDGHRSEEDELEVETMGDEYDFMQ
ncbi:hypothetical protein C0992_006004 [Termitomyces sp. T32_za158]|nr:hypothetical protein C0992_006004 [Termitomyces sp. T32_za158]